MGSKKLNNVLNLLIEEIKSKERIITNKESKSSKRKGVDIARSLLNEDSNIKEEKKNYINKNSIKNSNEGNHKREELEDPLKKNDQHKFNHKENERRRIINTNNNSNNSKDNNDIDQEKGREKENKNEQHQEEDEEEDEEENDSLSESEKQVLNFYDPTIDDYDEEYVTRKYRFMATDCDSSLCCCGCFTPVCYKSERHPTYVNQYKSLYAVSVAIEKERILKAKEINMKKVTQQINDSNSCSSSSSSSSSNSSSSSSNSSSDENAFSGTKSDEEKKEKKEEFYKYLNQAIEVKATVQTKNKKKKKITNYTYYPVFCVNCNNHLAYYEIETKLFHFFDVLPD